MVPMLVYQRVLPQWTSQQSMVLWYPPTWQSASTELQDIRTLKGCYLQGLVKSGKSISGAKKTQKSSIQKWYFMAISIYFPHFGCVFCEATPQRIPKIAPEVFRSSPGSRRGVAMENGGKWPSEN